MLCLSLPGNRKTANPIKPLSNDCKFSSTLKSAQRSDSHMCLLKCCLIAHRTGSVVIFGFLSQH